MDKLKNKNLLKKILLTLGVLTLVGVAAVLIVPEITNNSFAFAAGTPAAKPDMPQSLEQTISSTLRSLQDIVSIGLVLLNYLIWPILMIIGALMDNTLIIGPGMEQSLLSIWREVRNIVNIMFAVILLIIAIYNVLGLGEEGPLSGYAFKKILPKFILAIILVNFSFTISKLVLDSVDLFTNAIFAIPKKGIEALQATENKDAYITNIQKKLCASVFVEKLQEKVEGTGLTKTQMCKSKTEFTDAARKFFQQELNSNTAALMLAINMGQLHEQMSVSEILDKLGEAQKSDERSVIKLSDFLVNSLFSLIFFIVYTITFAVLALVLLVRVVVLWLCVALSPLIALMAVLPEELTGSLGEGLNFKEKFLKHAFAPVVIAFTMSIGFFMLTAYQMVGGVTPGRPEAFQLGVIISGITDIHKLIIAVGAIVVVWIGTFEAASGTVVSNITEGLKDTLQTWGKEVATAFKYATIIPVMKPGKDGKPGESSMSPHALLQAFNNPEATVKSAVEKLTGGGAAAAGAATAVIGVDKLRPLLRDLNPNSSADKWHAVLPAVWQNRNNPEIRQQFLDKIRTTDRGILSSLQSNGWIDRGQFDSLVKDNTTKLTAPEINRILGQNAKTAPAPKAGGEAQKPAGEAAPHAADAPAPVAPTAFASKEELQGALGGTTMDEAQFAKLTTTAESGDQALKELAASLQGLGLKKLQALNSAGRSALVGYAPQKRKIILEALQKPEVTVEQVDTVLAAIEKPTGPNYTTLKEGSPLKGIVDAAIEGLK